MSQGDEETPTECQQILTLDGLGVVGLTKFVLEEFGVMPPPPVGTTADTASAFIFQPFLLYDIIIFSITTFFSQTFLSPSRRRTPTMTMTGAAAAPAAAAHTTLLHRVRRAMRCASRILWD